MYLPVILIYNFVMCMPFEMFLILLAIFCLLTGIYIQLDRHRERLSVN